MNHLPPAVPEDRNENAAAYNGLLAVHKVYSDVFRPATKTLLKPTGVEQLYQANATRAFALFESLNVLDGPKHFQASSAVIRLLFEIAVEVELLVRAPHLLPGTDPGKKLIDRHLLIRDCMRLKRAHHLSKLDALAGTKAADICDKFVVANQAALDGQAQSEFGRPAHKCEHWSGMTLSDRASKLDELDSTLKFSEWYKNQYAMASLYAHGGLGGIFDAPREELAGVLTLLYDWASEFVPEHIMRPVCVQLKLNTGAPDVWQSVLQAGQAAQARRADFLARAPEIWSEHLAKGGG